MSRVSLVLIAFCFIVILLHAWGAIEPSHDNWGVHFFGFYDPGIALLGLGAALLLIIPKTQGWLVGAAEQFLRRLSRLPLPVNFLIVTGLLFAGAFSFPAQLHLLGDGAVLLRSINQAQWGPEIVKSFRNQPLMISIFHSVMSFYSSGASVKPYDVYFAIDLLACAIFLVLLFWFLKSIERPLIERVLLGCFLLGGAGSQFFFGYVENYALQSVFTAAFAVTGWYAMEKKASVIVPIVCFALMTSLHLGNLIFFPGILVLLYGKLGTNKLRALLAMAGLSAVILGFMFAVGFNLSDFLLHVTSGSVDFLQPFSADGGNFAYPMFSPAHLWDWMNTGLLVSPFALAIAITLLTLHRKELDWKDPALVFLLVTSAFGLLFTWIVNCALGMARDWDLLTGFFAPLIVLDVYLLSRPLNFKPRRYVLGLIAGITILHTGAWIGVNASADRHLRRMRLLNSPTYMSITSQLVFEEALANYYFDSGNFREAKSYYEEYVRVDNKNPRILANVADTYRRVGEKEKYFAYLQAAVAAKSRDPGVYLNLGVEYANRHDTSTAIRYNEQALTMDSTQKLAHANLGILYSSQRKFRLAERHFSTAIDLGLHEPALFRYAGDISFALGEYDRAVERYTSYLELVPSDKKVRESRDRAREAAAATNPGSETTPAAKEKGI